MKGESWTWETKRSPRASDWVWGYSRANVRGAGVDENIWILAITGASVFSFVNGVETNLCGVALKTDSVTSKNFTITVKMEFETQLRKDLIFFFCFFLLDPGQRAKVYLFLIFWVSIFFFYLKH